MNNKKWNELILPNGKTIEDLRKDNINWWKTSGVISDNPNRRKPWFEKFLSNVRKNKPDFSFEHYKGKRVGEACGGPYGGIIEMYLPGEDKYQIDVYADSFEEMNWISSSPEKTKWVAAPCEEISLENNFLDVLFAFNSIDHGWNVFKSIEEIVRVSKECFVSFDTNRYLKPGYPDLYHYQIIKLEEVKQYMDDNFLNNDLYDMKYLHWHHDGLDVFNFWIRKK